MLRRVHSLSKVEARADVGGQVRAIAAVATDGWDRQSKGAAERPRRRTSSRRKGAGQRPEWKDIADRSPRAAGSLALRVSY
jgi:hypothetical protein